MSARRILIALVTAAVLATTSACGFAGLQDLPLPGGPDVGAHSYVVSARFDNVLNLAPQSTVRLSGVTVGRVDAIRRDGWKAVVDLRIRGDVHLPADVGARISQTSLLGEKYVALLPPAHPTGQVLASGDVIDSGDTSRGRETEEVLGALALLLNGGGVGQLRTITTEMKDALGSQGQTRELLDELDRFVTTLDRNRGLIVRSLAHVDTLSGAIAREHVAVGQAITSITRATRVLAGQRTQLVALLRHLGSFSTVATSVVRRSGADLVADLTALRPVLAQLDSVGDDLPRVLETVLSFPFPDEVLDAVKGDYVNLDVLMDLSPLVIASNFTGGGTGTGGGLPLPPPLGQVLTGIPLPLAASSTSGSGSSGGSLLHQLLPRPTRGEVAR